MVGHAVVTGGAGFVGSWLCERLLGDGWAVTAVDNLVTGKLENLEGCSSFREFEFVRADVCEPFDVDKPVDVVFHLASPASPVQYAALPIETLRVGSRGTEEALALAERHRARFLFASSSEVYGEPEQHPQSEWYWGNVNPIGPRSVYDEAKRFGEALVSAFVRLGRVDATIVRIFNTYGPRMGTDDGRVVPTFMDQALRGEPLTVAGDGLQTRSLCYVSDTVEALVRAALSGLPGPFNVGSDDEITVAELGRAIIEVTGSTSDLKFIDRPEDDPTRRRPDLSMTRAALGWEAVVPLRDGLKRTVFSR